MIACTGLSRSFGATRVVADLTFELPAGSVCACLGRNGAGKSTLLKLLTGLLAPSAGRAVVDGLEVTGSGPELRRRIGVLPERLGLFEQLTLEEHLHLAGPLYGLSRAGTRERSAQLLRALGLERGRDTFAGQASMGMRKKAALALALLHNPRVLFLDEPFESVDPGSARAVRELIAALPGRGITVFFTSHALATAEGLASQFLFLEQGRMLRLLPAGELPASLAETYFELLPALGGEELPWLGWQA
jgi:ABC-2 type transport system ATP-binding protein